MTYRPVLFLLSVCRDLLKNLRPAVDNALKIKKNLQRTNEMTLADVVAMGGAEAIHACGGPPVLVQLGRYGRRIFVWCFYLELIVCSSMGIYTTSFDICQRAALVSIVKNMMEQLILTHSEPAMVGVDSQQRPDTVGIVYHSRRQSATTTGAICQGSLP